MLFRSHPVMRFRKRGNKGYHQEEDCERRKAPRYDRSKVDGVHLAFDEAWRVADRLLSMTRAERTAHPCVLEGRADFVLPGTAILAGICKMWPVGRLRVADRGVREGLLFESLGRLYTEDTRERTVANLIARQHIDVAQAQRIAATSEVLYRQVAKAWDLNGGDENLRLLHWAAQLHEIGMAVSHSQYHKHGGYLLANFDMPGFARGEQRRLAALVRSHRKISRL